MNARPRSTTKHPTSPQTTPTMAISSIARWMNGYCNGSVNHSITRTSSRCEHRHLALEGRAHHLRRVGRGHRPAGDQPVIHSADVRADARHLLEIVGGHQYRNA